MISLGILLGTIGVCLLISSAALASNHIYKAKNSKLENDLDNTSKKLEMEEAKNGEMYQCLDYIQKTGKIPEKVMNKDYKFQNAFNKEESRDNIIKVRNNSFVTNTNLSKKEKDNQKILDNNLLNRHH